MEPNRTLSQSSNKTVVPQQIEGWTTSSSPSSFIYQPEDSYSEKLAELLASPLPPSTLPDHHSDHTGDDEDEFRYVGVDGQDEDLLAARRAQWDLDVPERTEEQTLEAYQENMKEAMGEEVDGNGCEYPSIQWNEPLAFASPLTVQPTSPPHQPPRPAFLHPTVSRLRSHIRHPSVSSIHSASSSLNPPLHRSASSSHFSQLSRSESSSTLHSFLNPPVLAPISSSSGLSSPAPFPDLSQHDLIRYTPLKRISHILYPAGKSTAKLTTLVGGQGKNENKGEPTMMVAGGWICIGTLEGWVGMWDFRGDFRGWLGNESVAKEAGAVTALTLSPDHTHVVVGHAQGHIHIYTLLSSTPHIPTRTVPPITLPAALSGQKEGHLAGTKILHLGFVGKRRTAIISGDENGLAFYHSLGRVLGVDSVDVLRILGSYPDPSSSSSSKKKSSSSTTMLFGAQPLPLGSPDRAGHPTDAFHLSALMTSSKVVVVGLKPSPRTWFRRMRAGEGGEDGAKAGHVLWRPALGARLIPPSSSSSRRSSTADGMASVMEDGREESDPLLAFAWGDVVRTLVVRVPMDDGTEPGLKGKKKEAFENNVLFEEKGKWSLDGTVLGLKWVNDVHLAVLTSRNISIVDLRQTNHVERSHLDCRTLVPSHAALDSGTASRAGSVSVYKGRLFFLTKTDLRTGAIQSWTDRLLSLMEQGDLLSALQLATSFYLGQQTSTLLSLPTSAADRQRVVGVRLEELMRAALKYTFSEDRMTDGTHASIDGRGVDRTSLFEGLVVEITNACLALDDMDFLFDDVLDAYQHAWIDGIFFAQLEPFIIDGRIKTLPTAVVQHLLRVHDERAELDQLENAIWHVDPRCLDINQTIHLCQKHRLWDALIYAFTRSLLDYVSPAIELLGLVRQIQRHRSHRPSRMGDSTLSASLSDDEVEALVPDAYKLYAYLSHVLSGLTYPNNDPIPESEAVSAMSSVYSFLFSGRTVCSPTDGEVVLTAEKEGAPEPMYPYLRLLLRFDTEAFLHAMDIAFEDSYLNDDYHPNGVVSRQLIINLMLEVMTSDEFSSADLTLLHIFVSRNLPKYSQFIILPPSTLHKILVSLSSDPDQSTREDRQFAVEFLLSAYTPHDPDRTLALFQSAGFYRILRSIYRSERKWTALFSTYLDDPDTTADVFLSLDDILETVSLDNRGPLPSEIETTVLDAVPQLCDLGVRETARLIDEYCPAQHPLALQAISSSPHQQFGYLRCLLEPTFLDDGDDTRSITTFEPCPRLDQPSRQLYVSLLCQHDAGRVLALLETAPPDFYQLDAIVGVCEKYEVHEAAIWALDKLGETRLAFDKVEGIIKSRGTRLGRSFLALRDGDVGSMHHDLQDLRSVASMGSRLCSQHSQHSLLSSTTPLEDLWFGLLHELVELVHSTSAIIPGHDIPPIRSSSLPIPSSSGLSSLTDPPEAPQDLETVVLDSLRSLVQDSLASLVSCSTRSELSFSRLFKRLVDSASPSDSQPSRRAYSEFRSILTGMLDTYVAEGELLTVTTRLLERDLAEAVEDLLRHRSKGWRSAGLVCGLCGEPLRAQDEPSPSANALAPSGQTELPVYPPIVIFQSGRVYHQKCASSLDR